MEQTTVTTNRTTQLIVRMSLGEMEIIKATAKSKGMTVSKYVRELISNASNA